MRGFMEAVLAADSPADERVEAPVGRQSGTQEPLPDEIPFPSVSKLEESFTQEQAWDVVRDDLFGETPPPTMGSLSEDMKAAAQERKREIDDAVAEMTRIRERQERHNAPEVQGGPGEKEVAEWLRIPQT